MRYIVHGDGSHSRFRESMFCLVSPDKRRGARRPFPDIAGTLHLVLHRGLLCLAAIAGLHCTVVSAEDLTERQAYHVSIGLAVLEAGAPGDSFGKAEYFVLVKRQDPEVQRELHQAWEQSRSLEKDLRKVERQLEEPEERRKEGLTSKEIEEQEVSITSLNEQRADLQERLKAAQSVTSGLRVRLSASTNTISSSGLRMHFADEKLPLKVYEGDSVWFSVYERDIFENDKLGRKMVLLDKATLGQGQLQLSTGWVEVLEVEFIPAD